MEKKYEYWQPFIFAHTHTHTHTHTHSHSYSYSRCGAFYSRVGRRLQSEER
jgi:hypothetical protein